MVILWLYVFLEISEPETLFAKQTHLNAHNATKHPVTGFSKVCNLPFVSFVSSVNLQPAMVLHVLHVLITFFKLSVLFGVLLPVHGAPKTKTVGATCPRFTTRYEGDSLVIEVEKGECEM